MATIFCGHEMCTKVLDLKKPIIMCPFCECGSYCDKTCFKNEWILKHHLKCNFILISNILIKNYDKAFGSSKVSDGIFLTEFQQKEIRNKQKTFNIQDLSSPSYQNSSKYILGEGIYSSVTLQQNCKTGQLYVMKKIKTHYLLNEEVKYYFLNEINIHQRLVHPNIIKVEEILQDKNDYLLLLEYAEGGNLENYIRDHRKLRIDEAMFFFIQICNALNFLHSNNIIHRDIKSRNVLLTKDRIIKLCDFGWASILKRNERRTTFCGTFEYLAPEILEGKKYDNKVDIWSLGVLFFEMLNGFTPFEDNNCGTNYLQKNILTNNIKNSSEMNYESMEFAKYMLKTDPSQRPSIIEILNSPYIQKFLHDYYLQSVCPLIVSTSLLNQDSYKAICEDKMIQLTTESEEGSVPISEKIKTCIKINPNKFMATGKIYIRGKFPSENSTKMVTGKDNVLNHNFHYEIKSSNQIQNLHKLQVDKNMNITKEEAKLNSQNYAKGSDLNIPNIFELDLESKTLFKKEKKDKNQILEIANEFENDN